MCGDYSFMEGDDVAFYKQMSIADQVLELSSIDESKQVKEARKKKYHQFGLHKNSLVSLTRVEVAVVPLLEISKCFLLFATLIRQATAKYPITFTSNEEVIRRYHEEEHWKTDRVRVMHDLVLQNSERTLSEYWNQSYGIGNNVSDNFYNSHQPGGKLSNIMRVAELTKTTRELQTTAGVPSGSGRASSRGSVYSPTYTGRSQGSDGRKNRQLLFPMGVAVAVGPPSPSTTQKQLSSNANNALSADSSCHQEQPAFDQITAARRSLMSQVMLSSNHHHANSSRGSSCYLTGGGAAATDTFSSTTADRSKSHTTTTTTTAYQHKQRSKASRDAVNHQRAPQPIDEAAAYPSTKHATRGNRDAEQELQPIPPQPTPPPPRVRPSTSSAAAAYVGSNRSLRSKLGRYDNRQRPFSAVGPSGAVEAAESDRKPGKQMSVNDHARGLHPSLNADTYSNSNSNNSSSRQERSFDAASNSKSILRQSRDFNALKSDDFVKVSIPLLLYMHMLVQRVIAN